MTLENVTNHYEALAAGKETPIQVRMAKEFLTSAQSAGPEETTLYISKAWSPDNGDGTFNNPVIYADYSDPDVIRVGRDYYMTASSFSCFPGLPILHSRDLVNWTLIGHALRRYPGSRFEEPQHGKGVWAPSIRFRNDMFYIYWGDPDEGIYMVRSSNPAGPWEEPILVLPGIGMIDPCPLWDDDGRAYLVHAWAASRVGVKGLLTVRTMNAEGTQVSREGKHVFDGNGHQPTIEGPKFYRRNGYYYIFAPAGGVKTGWQLALRSRQIYGPYESRVVLEQGATKINGPHQGGWIETPQGRSWFLHFQDQGAYGRVVHLQPVVWQEDWPLMGRRNPDSGKMEPLLVSPKPEGHIAPPANPVESDEFDTDELGLQWQWQANPHLTWYALLRNTRYLRLFAEKLPHETATLWDAGNLLLQKFPGPDFTATTKVKFTSQGKGRRTGLVVMGRDYAALSLSADGDGFVLSQTVCENAPDGGREIVVEEVPLLQESVYLRVSVASPDALCRFSYSLDNKTWHELGKPFKARPGIWIGAKVGLFCSREHTAPAGGYADFDWFRVE